MYAQFFGLKQEPFSIAPDPRYLFMSERHREALAHLLYGVGGGGGFVLLTGEIGAGKTTVCRCFLEQIPKRCNVAYIFNPKLTVLELLKSVCDEFHIPDPDPDPDPDPERRPGVATVKDYIDPLNAFLLRTHAVGQNNVLIIDEAQNLSADVLEQLRLLTNLETSERKLLQIVLIGQPELRDMLARPELEQVAQRVIARFHLDALTQNETAHYIRHRLTVAGLNRPLPFDREARKRVHELSRGVPRRINLLCDRALLGAYSQGRSRVDVAIVEKAATEVFGKPKFALSSHWRLGLAAVGLVGLAVGAALFAAVNWFVDGGMHRQTVAAAARPASASSAPALQASASVAAAASAPASAGLAAASAPGPAFLSAADLKSSFKALNRDEKEAWRELAPAWRLTLGDDDPCVAAQRQQVQCFKTSSTLALIRQLGRPGILTLQDQDDKAVYALLTGLTGQAATLRVGGVSQNVSLVSLAQIWHGDFATFWRAPEGYRSVIADGSAGPVVDRLAAQLATLQGEPPPGPKQRVDAALKSKVFAFQLAQGLKPDGIAGPTTFMQLNRVTGVDEPRLQTELAAN